MHTLAYALFVPVFFVSIGLQANARALGLDSLAFVVAICVIAILSKVLGCGLGARLAGFSNGEAFRLGIGMISRGEVGLIVASVGVANGLIDDTVLAAIVVVVLVTTLVTPPMLREAYARAARRAPRQPEAKPASPNMEAE
jgi:Kef-type K+ transport system membrane component KefB